ncbi:hypothetical protein SUGI_0434560 [Cryptomeria japonica]|nr:hypothetical protein SUGI_0434560 [Cryptomeria japonica]
MMTTRGMGGRSRLPYVLQGISSQVCLGLGNVGSWGTSAELQEESTGVTKKPGVRCFDRIVMEPNLSLRVVRPMVAFWGQIFDERLSNVFRFDDREFLTRIKLVLGEEYLKAQFKYRSNVDIASMFTTWCFELVGGVEGEMASHE